MDLSVRVLTSYRKSIGTAHGVPLEVSSRRSIEEIEMSREVSLLNGGKVVVAVAGEIISKTRKSILAYGGDSGKLQVAIFSHTANQHHHHQPQPKQSESAPFYQEDSQEKVVEFNRSISARAVHSSLTSFLDLFDRGYGTVSTIHDIFEHDICGNLNSVSVGQLFIYSSS